MFTPYNLKRRPDQTTRELNKMQKELAATKSSLQVTSADGKHVIIIGNQPTDPSTKKPYPFGINQYLIKGDRLELESTWTTS